MWLGRTIFTYRLCVIIHYWSPLAAVACVLLKFRGEEDLLLLAARMSKMEWR